MLSYRKPHGQRYNPSNTRNDTPSRHHHHTRPPATTHPRPTTRAAHRHHNHQAVGPQPLPPPRPHRPDHTRHQPATHVGEPTNTPNHAVQTMRPHPAPNPRHPHEHRPRRAYTSHAPPDNTGHHTQGNNAPAARRPPAAHTKYTSTRAAAANHANQASGAPTPTTTATHNGTHPRTQAAAKRRHQLDGQTGGQTTAINTPPPTGPPKIPGTGHTHRAPHHQPRPPPAGHPHRRTYHHARMHYRPVLSASLSPAALKASPTTPSPLTALTMPPPGTPPSTQRHTCNTPTFNITHSTHTSYRKHRRPTLITCSTVTIDIASDTTITPDHTAPNPKHPYPHAYSWASQNTKSPQTKE